MEKQLSFCQKLWKFREKKIESLEKLQESILENLGLSDSEKIQKFINPSLSDLRDPFDLKDMDKAVERTLESIEKNERIMVCGDFDADGITSTVILVNVLQECGANVSYFIPDRTNDSHGLQKRFMDNFAGKNVSLVITCDCATNDHEEISYGKSLGIETIVTDHHKMDKERFPHDAIAVVNCQTSQNAAEKNLSGSAMAFKFASALLSKKFAQNPAKFSEILDPLFEIATIGIISDCVKIVGDNRIIAKYGLAKMKNTSWDGLKLLMEKLKLNDINEETIGFSIAPHLNAASRLGNVMIAVQLFIGNPAKNGERVEYLVELNKDRRLQTDLVMKSAEKQIMPNASCQFLFGEDWPQGIMGLAASNFAEKLNVPVIVGTIRQIDNMLSTSCRAPAGFSIIDGLQDSAELMKSFGGHAGAAGFIAKLNNLEIIRGKLNNYFDQSEKKTSVIKAESFLDTEILSMDLIEFLKFIAPFGAGNPAKVFGVQNVEIIDIYLMGKDKNHARFTGKTNEKEIKFVAFFADNFLENIKKGSVIDILVTISENKWKGKTSLQLKLVDARNS